MCSNLRSVSCVAAISQIFLRHSDNMLSLVFEVFNHLNHSQVVTKESDCRILSFMGPQFKSYEQVEHLKLEIFQLNTTDVKIGIA